MNTFFKRLLLIIENQGFKNLNDFALNGLKYDSSSKLNRLKDEKKKPSVEILEDISNKFQNIDLHWLLTGKGEMLRNAQETKIELTQKDNKYILSLEKNVELLEEKLQQCQEEKKIAANSKSNV